MLGDFPVIFTWWLLLFSLGIFSLPITLSLFNKFWDKGYLFAKIITLLFGSYFIWLLASLKLTPFSQKNSWGIFIFLGIINLIIFKKKYFVKLQDLINNYGKIWVYEEALFFFCLLFWSLIRGFQPNINGLEKYMDYGFINSILRSKFFPPKDMWMSGETINYYYFGHLVSAVLTKLSGFDSTVTYNLMIATIFALCFTAVFSLASNLVSLSTNKKKLIILGGLISTFLLSLGGNLQLFWHFFKNKTFTGYWYPDATRFIIEKFGAADNTIHEFPIYSFVVADLHGHLSDVPFVLLFLALLLVFFIESKKTPTLYTIRYTLLPAFVLAVMFMTNAWDFPIYFLILGAVLLWRNWKRYGLKIETLFRTATAGICCLFFFFLFSLPFHLNFENIAKGINFVDFRSPVWMLFFLWGFPLFMTINFLGFFIKQKRKKVDYFIVIFLLTSWFLILVPEIIYVKDIYIHSYQRANTIFKLTYQSFVMFALCSGYIIIRIATSIKKKLIKNLFVICYLLFVILLLSYPYFAVTSYYGLKKYQGLDGLKYLQTSYSDDYQVILWIKEEIFGQPVILEAVGESYTDFARISSNTGIPTVLGWPVHEWLWRGSYDEPGKRREDIRKIYELENMEETESLLKKYDVDYVFLGALEKKEYKNLSEEKFNQLGEMVFQEGETRIYKIEVRD